MRNTWRETQIERERVKHHIFSTNTKIKTTVSTANKHRHTKR